MDTFKSTESEMSRVQETLRPISGDISPSQRDELTAKELREILSDNLRSLRNGKMFAESAKVQSQQIREISRLYLIQMRGLTAINQDYTDDIKVFLGVKR